MNSRSIIRYILFFILLILAATGYQAAGIYRKVFVPNIHTPGKQVFYLHIPTGSSYKDVLDSLYDNNLIKNKKTFEWAAAKKKFPVKIHPGRYRLKNNMTNNELVNMLRSGAQEPVDLVINTARTLDELAEKVAGQIEPGTDELFGLLTDVSYISAFGFNEFSVIGMFLPNTYEFWWNTSTDAFFKRMNKEYEKFWNHERTAKASEINLSRNQVITLASILISETNKPDEYRRMAGVYINRLKKGIKLQADPTIKYALRDFDRQRVLKADTRINSPYNTYLFYGLPPGPIAIPSLKAIDAVLNYEKNDYLYFCAREDFSGYHNYARTLEQHNKNARSYQKALNQRKILK
jgi:UPF0755 protein